MAKKRVHLGATGRPALAEPQFIVEHDGKLYLTVAALEYDEDEAQSDHQRDDIRALKGMLGDATAAGESLRAAVLTSQSPPLQQGQAMAFAAMPAMRSFAATDPPDER